MAIQIATKCYNDQAWGYQETDVTANYTVDSGTTTDCILSCSNSSTITVTLPASPSPGRYLFVKDTNNNGGSRITIARNGNTLNGGTSNIALTNGNSTIFAHCHLIYVSSAVGWIMSV